MPLDLESFSQKLRMLRGDLQLSLEDVAAATNTTSERLERLEAGQGEPTGDEVLILATYFRCDYNLLISNTRLVGLDEAHKMFRAQGRDLPPQDRRAIHEALFMAERAHDLGAELGRTVVPFAFSSSDSYMKRQGRDAAIALHRALGHDFSKPQLDVYAAFRAIGIHVFRRRLANKLISGLYLKHPVAGSCVLVNYDDDVYRQRFTAAHEAGHAILDSDEFGISFTAKPEDALIEARANSFAACYLLPPHLLERLPPPGEWSVDQTRDIAIRLGVSTKALSIALTAYQLADKAVARRIESVRVPQSAKEDPELPRSLSAVVRQRKKLLLERGLAPDYVSLCFDAYRAQLISLGRLAECLLTTPDGVPPLARAYGDLGW